MTNANLPATVLSPGASLAAYVQNVSSIPVLSREEEQDLAERLYFREDLDAARQLVMAHLRFVVYIARSYSGYGLPESDLIQEGNVGLMKAVKRFNPEHGVRLVSFAVHWIKAEIHEYVLRNWRIVKVATTKAQRKLFFNLRKNKKQLQWLNNDEVHAIAEDLGVRPKDVRQMEGRLASVDMSYDMPVDDSDSKSYLLPANTLAKEGEDPALLVEQTQTSNNEQAMLMNALSDLDERSQDILRQRWLSNQKATLHDLAAKYGVSAERIRQLEANAMKKIRAKIEVDGEG